MDFKNLDSYSQEELEEILDNASNSYYNSGKEELTDEEFDFLKEFLISKFPKTSYKNKTGYEVTGEKVKLPYWMGSMTNIKDNNNNHSLVELELSETSINCG